MSEQAIQASPAPGPVLTQAVLRAGQILGLNQSGIAGVLGLSPATVSRMANGGYVLDESKKEWELGALFVRLFRSLDAIVGSNDAAARAWLDGENLALNGRPGDLIRSTEGLVRVVHYLDAARGRI